MLQNIFFSISENYFIFKHSPPCVQSVSFPSYLLFYISKQPKYDVLVHICEEKKKQHVWLNFSWNFVLYLEGIV